MLFCEFFILCTSFITFLCYFNFEKLPNVNKRYGEKILLFFSVTYVTYISFT